MSENIYLSGNFAPVEDELTAENLRVTGEIPRELEGRLLRIGPNPVAADPATYHWFAGTGMAHGVRLRDGRAEWYRRRYVRDDEVAAVRGGPPVEGPRHGNFGFGGANTNIIGLADRTFAIIEAGAVPVELDYELETVARCDFDGTLPGGFTAHPKRDPETGEIHAAVYYLGWDYVQHVVVGPDARVRKALNVPLPNGRPMIHDCAFTENWFVILDLPVLFTPGMIQEGFRLPYRWTPEYGARVGLLPRNATSGDEVIWSEVDPCWVFHPMNAYEDADGRVVMDVTRHPKMFATDMHGPNEGPPTLDRWIVDPSGGPVKEERIDERGHEFPRHDERLIGKPYRYGYSAGVQEDFQVRGGLYKYDLEKRETQVYDQGDHRQFMEAVFVPRTPDAAEDDGYLMAYLYDARENRSDVVILHAQDFGGEPVATIHLPDRVPFGFHSNWVPDGR